LKKIDTPEAWSLEATDFINKCISRRPETRLGLNNCIELRTHVWLKDFNWRAVAKREMPAPFKPKKMPFLSKKLLKAQEKTFTKTCKTDEFNQELLENAQFQALFDDFYFNIDTEVNLERKVKN
jgi:hypothetical protein